MVKPIGYLGNYSDSIDGVCIWQTQSINTLVEGFQGAGIRYILGIQVISKGGPGRPYLLYHYNSKLSVRFNN